MKTYIILIAIVIAAFLSEGCTRKINIDFKVTVAPVSKSSVVTLNDMKMAADIIGKKG